MIIIQLLPKKERGIPEGVEVEQTGDGRGTPAVGTVKNVPALEMFSLVSREEFFRILRFTTEGNVKTISLKLGVLALD